MTKTVKLHLENITVKNLTEFKDECFIEFASSIGKNSKTSIGINPNNEYVVKYNKLNLKFKNPQDAIDKYSDLIS